MMHARLISKGTLLVVALLLTNFIRPSPVQGQESLVEGDRVRLTIRLWAQAIPTTLVGVLLNDSSDSLTVDTGKQQRTGATTCGDIIGNSVSERRSSRRISHVDNSPRVLSTVSVGTAITKASELSVVGRRS